MFGRHDLSRVWALLCVVALTGVFFAGWPSRAQAQEQCVAGPGESCQVSCAVGGSAATLTGTAMGSSGAQVQGCGVDATPCADGCEVVGVLSTGSFTCSGGTRTLTCQTAQSSSGSPPVPVGTPLFLALLALALLVVGWRASRASSALSS